MEDKHRVRLGAVQETLFIPLAARALESGRKRDIDARWAWSCDDPRSLERFGLEVMESASITRPPRAMRSQTARPLPVPDAARRSGPGQDHGHHLVPSQLPGSGRLGFQGAGGRAGDRSFAAWDDGG